jgi:putative endonuclease
LASTLREIKASAFVLGFSFLWMATVYIIYSKSIDKFYVGSCLNIVERLEQHNTHVFQVGFTHRANDWEVYYSKEITSQDLARKIETHIKAMRSRVYYQNLLKYPEIMDKLIEKYS